MRTRSSASGVTIYEHTPVTEIGPRAALTSPRRCRGSDAGPAPGSLSLRWAAIHGVYSLYRRADRSEQRSARPSRLGRFVDALSGRR